MLTYYAAATTSWLDTLMYRHPSASFLSLWGLALLSYHQDVRVKTGFGILSQVIAIVSLIALTVFGFTTRSWPNFIIVPFAVWLQIELTKRWNARPHSWW